MFTPPRLEPLIEACLIDQVLAQLKSGKEAEVYVVANYGDVFCAKVYKESNNRSFKHSSQYTEGRKVRNSRQSRAMDNNSRFGRKQKESQWQSAEAEALAILGDAGVRVPRTFEVYEGVLLMEMICDADGHAAPRFSELKLNAEEARKYHTIIIHEVVLMLLAGYIHGDLSEFNILLAHDGPVIIDLPQAVQATANNAKLVFTRDVEQLRNYFGRFAPDLLSTNYAREIWALFESGKLKPHTQLSGRYVQLGKKADVASVMSEIADAREDEEKRRGIKK